MYLIGTAKLRKSLIQHMLHKMMVRQIGPGMIQQSQVQCSSCKGKGKFIKNEDKCGTCHGGKITNNKHTLDVNIRKGIQNNEQIKFVG